VVIRGDVHIVDFVVVDEPDQPSILGLSSFQRLNLIRRVHSMEVDPRPPVPPVVTEFLDVFLGLSKLLVERHINTFGYG
jgi:hypothetical protein